MYTLQYYYTKTIDYKSGYSLSLQCPVNDLPKNVKSKGIYQTMINSSFLTINVMTECYQFLLLQLFELR